MRGLFFGGTLAGALLGFGLGLAVAWVYIPVPLWKNDPADLRLNLKDDYLRMIASSYILDGDMARALRRLDSLNLGRPDVFVAALVGREPQPLYQQALIHLAIDLKQTSVAMARPTLTPRPTKTRQQARPAPTALPRTTVTTAPPLPTLSPATAMAPEVPTPLLPTSFPNPDAPLFVVSSRSALGCLDTGGRGLIEVDVQDTDGRPLPGIGVEASWNKGDAVFYTGLKPERGMGYADIELSPGTYSVRLSGGGRSDVTENLRIDGEPGQCTGDAPQVRGWKLVYRRSG